MMCVINEITLAFLKWLVAHGIDPEIPLVAVSMAAGWYLHIIFVELRKRLKGE